ncbi:MAG TPA: amino acid permease [Acidobacteriota bacterium]|nr:amino acid permease [Acidobacteriota bacterium]
MTIRGNILEALRAITHAERGDRRFGTFGGVFTPTVLTVLGVIMYLRLGWVVGNAGLIGAIAIILLAKSVTLCTGLSMSSITTNIRIGAGGAYSIISKSLGLEAGGSVGIPFYISLTLSAALYIIGFTAGWLLFFPNHEPLIVSSVVWFVLLAISYASARFAIRVQYVIMVIIAISLISIFLTPNKPIPTQDVPLLGDFGKADFWTTFAIFFPAVTGIMAGANMSGELKDPRKAIPNGTLTGIAVTLFIYIGLAVFLAFVVPTADLLNTDEIVLEKIAFWSPAVTLGILAATFSSALGSMVGGPRVLQALAEQETVPFSPFFATKTKKGEPRNAIFVTGIAVEIAIVFGNLDALATLITMFFLITYGMLNLVVFIQQSMRIISFRPTFRIPRFVSLLGAFGCALIMFLINAVFSIVAIITIIALYVWLERKGLKSDWGDIRGGIFLAIAEKASRIAARFPRHQISWKPDLLIPIDDPRVWPGPLLFINDIVSPSGSIFAFTVRLGEEAEILASLDDLLLPLKERNVLVSTAAIDDDNFVHGSKMVIQTLKGGAFRPNTLFLTLGSEAKNDPKIKELVEHATSHGMGVVILRQHSRVAFGMQNTVNLWLRDRSPNWNLATLLALQLQTNWDGTLNLITVAENKRETKRLRSFMEQLGDVARFPLMTELHVLVGNFKEALEAAPRGDINIFGLAPGINCPAVRDIAERAQSSCLFVKDSGLESALV